MLELGVRLEDRGDDSIWKLEDPAVLRREQQAKQQAAAEQKLKKAVMAHSKKQAVSLVTPCHTSLTNLDHQVHQSLTLFSNVVSILPVHSNAWCHWGSCSS